ncbi:MAG: HD-GYP domain-containing protein [Acidiferrobacterales bacterium]
MRRSGGEYCCEGCVLKEHAFRELESDRDDAYLALAESLAAALDVREHETGLHSKRVACHTLVLAKRFTDDVEILRQIYWGSLLHDIGKIGIPDAVLLKPGPLTDQEWSIMRRHPELGHQILANVPFMAPAAEIVMAHEERFDGSGYPLGLAAKDIPWGARLFALIDALDAMTSVRPYQPARNFDVVANEIRQQAGRQFDPEAVAAFDDEEKVLRDMVEIKCFDANVPAPAGVVG